MALVSQHPLCIFLLILISFSWSMGAASGPATFPVSEGLGWKDHKYFQVPADMKRSEVLAFLSGLADWASYSNMAPLSRQKTDLRPRQERATFPQPSARKKSPCKNFFWKTFSSC